MIKKIIYTLLSTFISVDIVYANVCLNYFRNNGKSLATTKIFSSKKAISKSVIIDWSTGELKLSGEQPLTDSLKKNQVLINNAIIERDSIGNAKKVSWFSHAQNGYGGENGYFGNTIQFRVTVELTKNGFIKKIKTSESQLLGTTYENLLKANENDVYSDAKYSSEFKFHYKGNKLKSIKYSAKSNDGIFSPAPLAMRNITEFIIKDDIHSRSVSWFTNSFAPVVAYKKADHLVRTMEQQILEQSSIGLNKLQLVGSESTPIVKLLRELKLGSVANQNKSQFVSDSKKMIIKALYAGELENILNLYITENKLDSSTKNNIESLNLSGVLENYLDSMYDRLINDNSSEAATMAAVLQMTNQDKQAITNNSNKFSEDLKPHIIIETSKKNPQFQIIYKVENHTDKIDFYKNFYYELISNNSELNTITVSVKSNRHTHNYRDISKNTATGSEEYQVVFKKTGTPQRTVIHSIKLKNDFFPTLNTEINSYKFKKLLENIGLSNMFLSKSDWFDFQSSDPMLFKPQNVIVGSVIENLFLGKADFKLNMLRPYMRPHPNTNLPKVHPATKNLSSKFKFYEGFSVEAVHKFLFSNKDNDLTSFLVGDSGTKEQAVQWLYEQYHILKENNLGVLDLRNIKNMKFAYPDGFILMSKPISIPKETIFHILNNKLKPGQYIDELISEVAPGKDYLFLRELIVTLTGKDNIRMFNTDRNSASSLKEFIKMEYSPEDIFLFLKGEMRDARILAKLNTLLNPFGDIKNIKKMIYKLFPGFKTAMKLQNWSDVEQSDLNFWRTSFTQIVDVDVYPIRMTNTVLKTPANNIIQFKPKN